MNNRIIVTGHGTCGKGTICSIFKRIGFDSISSSEMACKLFLFDKMVAEGYDYKTWQECHADRMNRRQYWFENIRAYNEGDLTKLARQIFAEFPIYDGIRNKEELDAIKSAGLVDAVVWIDASERVPVESSASMTVTREDCDIVLDNNLPLESGNVPERVAEIAYAFLSK